MRINLIIGSFYPALIYGGPTFSTFYASRELAKLDIEVFVSTTNINGDKKLDIEPNKFIKLDEHFFVKYYGWSSKKTAFSIPLILNIWKEIRNSDLIHIQSVFSFPTPVSLFYARLFNKPVLLSPRGSLGGWCLKGGSRYKFLWLKLLIEPHANRIFWHACSEQEKCEIKALYPTANVFVIPNGINIMEFEKHNKLSKEEFIKKYTDTNVDCKQIIISMGRLHKVKGFDVLIDAFHIASKSFPSAILLIAGQDEGEKRNLLHQVRYLGLENRVFLVGQLNGQDKVDFLSNADIFVLSSHSENFGIACAEAMAAGIPVIASRNTPWSELEVYNCGKWVGNSKEEISIAIASMLQADYKEMGKKAKKYITDKFEWKNIAILFKKAYESILGINIADEFKK